LDRSENARNGHVLTGRLVIFTTTIYDASDLQALLAAPRALVFLTVPWSGPERKARVAFDSAVEQLADADIFVCKLDEDTERGQQWLSSLNIPGYTSPVGAGTILWMSNGRVMHQSHGCALTAKEIVERTRFFWPKLTA